MRTAAREAALGMWAVLLFALQRLRLRVERLWMDATGRRERLLAIASWQFPDAAHKYVCQELTRCIEGGLTTRLLYAEPAVPGDVPTQFRQVWSARRRLHLHPAVCRRSVEYFARRSPARVAMLEALLGRSCGWSSEVVREHPHLRQAFAVARLAEAFGPAYVHSFFLYEGTLFAFVAAYLLTIPRGLSFVGGFPADDYPLRAADVQLRQCSLIIAEPAEVRTDLQTREPRLVSSQLSDALDAAAVGRIRQLMRPGRRRRLAADAGAAPALVSVVIIFLNAHAYLSDAIDSVLLQTDDRWELLLVDDGSTDGSSELARAAAARYPHQVRYLEHEGHRNLGMSATRNYGVSQASGRYIAFLDADDVWVPFKLAQQIAILDANPEVAMVFGAAEYWHGWTGAPADRARDHVPDLGIEADRIYAPPVLALRLYPLGSGTAPCPSDIMVRRDAFNRVGGFDAGFRGENQLYEDQAFLAKMYVSHGVFISSTSWIRYRIHPESCSSAVQGSGRYVAVRRYFLDWLAEYFASQPTRDTAVDGALARARASMDVQPASTAADPVAPVTPPGPVNLGDLRRLTPISRNWGFERGRPVDRVYIEAFLARHAADVQGRALEVEDNVYTRRFGGDRVHTSDVLHVVEGNPRATLVGDLTRADHIPSDTFDCIVLTQVLQLIYDTRAALATMHRILKPGGVLLATFPGLSRISHTEWEGSWFWQFTSASSRRLLRDAFPEGDIHVEPFGNVLAAGAFLYGLAAEDLTEHELHTHDPDYEVLIGVRAQKART